MIKQLFLFGAGGHAKVVLDAARLQGYQVLAVFDDDPARAGGRLMDCAVLGGRDDLLAWHRSSGVQTGIVAIGNNQIRAAMGDWLAAHGFALASVVHPAAIVASSARIGAGTLIMPGAVVNADAGIGGNVILNSGAIVEHDCMVGDGAHVAPGAVLCGGVSVGAGTLVGAGAVVLPGVRIGAELLVKAGAVVARDMEADA
jgi:sugar O-acyltransferase (sialic acid O-acetyltransferase NeuD family)